MESRKGSAHEPTTTVSQYHLEDLGGREFERLVFAYHLRTERWKRISWHGQVGKDKGRDIIGFRDDDTPRGALVYIQCANRVKLTLFKTSTDLKKALKSPSGKPDEVRVVCPHGVSGTLRERIEGDITKHGIAEYETWFGAEFEEFCRRDCESLLKRFCKGEVFPDAPNELLRHVQEIRNETDEECLAQIARIFDRPAFYTPLHLESSVPAFREAIADSIRALNTGIWQTREGVVIARIPTRHDLKDLAKRAALETIERSLSVLRAEYDLLQQRGEIRPCQCTVAGCPTYILSERAIRQMNILRADVLARFRNLYPPFATILGWLRCDEAIYPGAEVAIRPGSLTTKDRPRRFDRPNAR